MKGIASLWLDSHSELVDSIETYVFHDFSI